MVSTSGCTFATPQRFKRMSRSKSHSRSRKSEAETKLDFKCFLGSLGGTGLSPPELSVRRLAFQPGPGWYFPDPPWPGFSSFFSGAFYSPRQSRYLSARQPLTAESSLSEGITVASSHCPHYWQVTLSSCLQAWRAFVPAKAFSPASSLLLLSRLWLLRQPST